MFKPLAICREGFFFLSESVGKSCGKEDRLAPCPTSVFLGPSQKPGIDPDPPAKKKRCDPCRTPSSGGGYGHQVGSITLQGEALPSLGRRRVTVENSASFPYDSGDLLQGLEEAGFRIHPLQGDQCSRSRPFSFEGIGIDRPLRSQREKPHFCARLPGKGFGTSEDGAMFERGNQNMIR